MMPKYILILAALLTWLTATAPCTAWEEPRLVNGIWVTSDISDEQAEQIAREYQEEAKASSVQPQKRVYWPKFLGYNYYGQQAAPMASPVGNDRRVPYDYCWMGVHFSGGPSYDKYGRVDGWQDSVEPQGYVRPETDAKGRSLERYNADRLPFTILEDELGRIGDKLKRELRWLDMSLSRWRMIGR